MTFNDDSDISKGRVSRRGRTAGIAGGGGILLVIAVAVISQLTGVDVSGLVGPLTGGGGTQQGPVDTLEQCDTGSDANEQIDCRMKGAAASLDTYWEGELRGYEGSQIVLFSGSVSTGCGNASSAVGPFYCPPDASVYIDTGFFDELETRFGANDGTLAQLYVVAHEWGHHVQNLSGAMEGLDRQSTGPASDGVRLELQADCYAGAWVGAAETIEDDAGRTFLEPVTDQQIADALSAAAAVGDDRIQESTSGQVNPEAWTHGASEQRQAWFETGRTEGPGACDTFSVPAGRL
ncbi:KPN_02809 family neutral zinc metallopeptidase [Homoserinibacter sp. YIM 151385]|uniref:KPN_02809 family neutral zinc metallopeptidase n=1 Tax=Homoserinibacter sp. YIM 151385 TaxID=2985506 RepID=UPI0022F07710|nr:neutral zinc metallopeptidase [Homoserinibacter sp. YIM 151385]WBU37430.1 neutral zinc metallopeptidase [Homoserinibacter sp. YIM 151385]